MYKSYQSDVLGWQHICTLPSVYSFTYDIAGNEMLAEEWIYPEALHDFSQEYVFNSSFLVRHETNRFKNIQTAKTYEKVETLSKHRTENIKDGVTFLADHNEKIKLDKQVSEKSRCNAIDNSC